MRRLSVGVLITALVLAVAGVAAFRDSPTLASSLGRADSRGPSPAASLAEPEPVEEPPSLHLRKRAFVGITLRTLSEEELETISIPHGVQVGAVLDGGPSAGKLLKDDVILAVNDEAVTSAQDVVRVVLHTGPGTDVTFKVLRGGDELDVTVTVGHRPQGPALYERLLGLLHGLIDKLVRIELVVETDEGLKTLLAAVGTVENLNVDEGTFTLSLSDGSFLDLEVTDTTHVNTNQVGYLGGVKDGEKALAVTVGGELMLLRQPLPTLDDHAIRPKAHAPKFRFRFPGRERHDFRGFRALPELRECLKRAVPFERLECADLDVEEFLGDLPFDLEYLPSLVEPRPDPRDDIGANAL